MDKYCNTCLNCEVVIQGCNGVIDFWCNKFCKSINKDSCCEFYEDINQDEAEAEMMNEDQQIWKATKHFK